MSVQPGLQQVQKQAQTLVLAPQLRQSLKILQVPALDLRNVILEELQTNPALEELPMDGISLDENGKENDNEKSEPEKDSSGEELEFDANYEFLSKLDEDSRDYYARDSETYEFSSEAEERRQHFFDSLTMETSLQEHLISQAHLTEASEEVIECLEYLIGSLDDRGFLTASLQDIALMSGYSLSLVQETHQLLKNLDPPGIGSNGLKDCLLTQLAMRQEQSSLASRIVKDCYDLFLRRRIPDIARKLGVELEEVQEALDVISRLDPSPGRKFGEDTNQVVEPDVTVTKDDGEWIISLNSDYIPRLRLSKVYKDMIARGKLSAKEKNYIQEKIKSGKFLMSSIEQRQQTIERITRKILEFQLDFFEEGVSKLKPLTMNQVADAVGVHETTVSRAIANKYIETPHGTFEFKFFFTSGYLSEKGESVSNTSIKEIIAKIIEMEDRSKPLSDMKIVEKLKERNIKIARRTVAKYREELGILPTSMRRQYG